MRPWTKEICKKGGCLIKVASTLESTNKMSANTVDGKKDPSLALPGSTSVVNAATQAQSGGTVTGIVDGSMHSAGSRTAAGGIGAFTLGNTSDFQAFIGQLTSKMLKFAHAASATTGLIRQSLAQDDEISSMLQLTLRVSYVEMTATLEPEIGQARVDTFTLEMPLSPPTPISSAQAVVTASKLAASNGSQQGNVSVQSINASPKSVNPSSVLHFTTTGSALEAQFGAAQTITSGFKVFTTLPSLGILFALSDRLLSTSTTMASVFDLCDHFAPSWLLKLLGHIPVQLRKADRSRCGIWLFIKPVVAILRLEFELASSLEDDIRKGLLEFLPECSSFDFHVVAKKTASLDSMTTGDNTASVESEIVLCTSIAFDTGPETVDSNAHEPEYSLFLQLIGASITFTIHNVNNKGSFCEILLMFAKHLEEKLESTECAGVLRDLPELLQKRLLQAKPAGKSAENRNTSEVKVAWRTFSMTVKDRKLTEVNMVLELDTPFGVAKETSVFLLDFSWSIIDFDFIFTGSFWPNNSPGSPLELSKAYNPYIEEMSILKPLSQSSQRVLSLLHLYPHLTIDENEIPRFIPTDITVLDLHISKKGVGFHCVLQTREHTVANGTVPELSLSKLSLEFFFNLTFDKPPSVSLSFEASLKLNSRNPVKYPDCTIDLRIEYANNAWLLRAETDSLHLSCLQSLLPAEHGEAMLDLMEHVVIQQLFVQYGFGKGQAKDLEIKGIIDIGGLELTLNYHHKEEWSFTASLLPSNRKLLSKDPTVEEVLRGITGSHNTDLPSFIADYTVPLHEVEVELKCLEPKSTELTDKYLLFSVSLTIKALRVDFVQLKKMQIKPQNGSSAQAGPVIKRFMRVSLGSLPSCPKIPVVGQVKPPFDQLNFYWVSEDIINDEKMAMDIAIFAGVEVAIKNTKTDMEAKDVVLKQGFHFVAISHTGSEQKVLIDYVFGAKKASPNASPDQKKPTSATPTTVDGATTAVATTVEPQAQGKSEGPAESSTQSQQSEMVPVKNSQFGLSITNVGMQMSGKLLTIHLNAVAHLGPIELAFTGFEVHFDLTNVKFPHLESAKPSFSLQGLGVSYSRKPIELAGYFAKTSGTRPDVHEEIYQGGIIIGLTSYKFIAAGAYEIVTPATGQPYKSLFVFGILKGLLIEFEFAEVRGIIGGLGYNSHLALPAVNDIPSYPFFLMANEDGSDPMGILTQLSGNSVVSPKDESLWFAAGLLIRAFQIVDISAVITVELGVGEPVMALLAEAVASVPGSTISSSHPFALIDFALVATLDLGHSVVSVEGQITPRSFILDHDCHPTGGFALYKWSKGSVHEGEFVFTVGGFHPAFARPAHYPNPPRLGISWKYDNHLSITGEAYYAITSSACMAGAKLSAIYSLGQLSAHFDAYADFLINYEPFQYQANIGVTAGVYYTMHVGLITKHWALNLGAELHLHGPPMAGTVHVNFFIHNFNIDFGPSHKDRPALTLNEFWEMLRHKSDDQEAKRAIDNHVVSYENGIVVDARSQKKGRSEVPSVRAGALVFSVETKIPISQTIMGQAIPPQGAKMLSKPMQLQKGKELSSDITISVNAKRDGTGPDSPFFVDPIYKKVPAAIWGECKLTSSAEELTR